MDELFDRRAAKLAAEIEDDLRRVARLRTMLLEEVQRVLEEMRR